MSLLENGMYLYSLMKLILDPHYIGSFHYFTNTSEMFVFGLDPQSIAKTFWPQSSNYYSDVRIRIPFLSESAPANNASLFATVKLLFPRKTTVPLTISQISLPQNFIVSCLQSSSASSDSKSSPTEKFLC